MKVATTPALVALLLFPALLWGQAIDPDVAGLENDIAHTKAMIEQWESLAFRGLLLGLALVTLGGTVTALQPFGSKRWCIVTVAIIGVTISALSFLRDDAEASYKTYRQNAEMGKEQLQQAETLLARLKKETSVDGRAAVGMQLAERLEAVKGLKAKMLGTAVAVDFPLVGTAFAQPAQPAWTRQAKSEDASTFRFVGVGSDRSLTNAQAKALEAALQNAVRDLGLSLDSAKLYARQTASFTEWDDAQGVYRQYVQMRLNRALIRK